MDRLSNIIRKYEEFGEFLAGIDLDELRKNHSRYELEQLREQITKVSICSVGYELGKLTDELKKEEHPKLLGVHNFPVLETIDFLTDAEKIDLDRRLAVTGKGNYFYQFGDIVKDTKKEERLKEWLVEKGVMMSQYTLICGYCGYGHITLTLSGLARKRLLEALAIYKENSDDGVAWDMLHNYFMCECTYCERELDVDILVSHLSEDSMRWRVFYALDMERDSSLDRIA